MYAIVCFSIQANAQFHNQLNVMMEYESTPLNQHLLMLEMWYSIEYQMGMH